MEKDKYQLRNEKIRKLLKEFEGMSEVDWSLFKQILDRYYSSKSREIKIDDMEHIERLTTQVLP